MKRKFIIFTTVFALFGGLTFSFNANAGFPCSGDKIPVFKKKIIGELICVQGDNNCIKCKRSLG